VVAVNVSATSRSSVHASRSPMRAVIFVDVGDVLDVAHVVADVVEPAVEDIGVEPQAGVSEVGRPTPSGRRRTA